MQRTTLDPPTEPTPAVTADTMKAIVQDRYGSGEVLELREIDKPAIGDHDVLVRVRAAAVNPGDWAIMSGLPYIARPAPLYGLRRPKNPVRGVDVAGQVAAVGVGVTRLRPGDKVFGWCHGALPNMRQRPKLSYRRSQPTSRSKRQRPFPWRAPAPSRRFVITAMSRPDKRSWSTVRRGASGHSPCRSRRRSERTSPACAARQTSTWSDPSALIT